MAPPVGFEPTTSKLTASCSTIELQRISGFNIVLKQRYVTKKTLLDQLVCAFYFLVYYQSSHKTYSLQYLLCLVIISQAIFQGEVMPKFFRTVGMVLFLLTCGISYSQGFQLSLSNPEEVNLSALILLNVFVVTLMLLGLYAYGIKVLVLLYVIAISFGILIGTSFIGQFYGMYINSNVRVMVIESGYLEYFSAMFSTLLLYILPYLVAVLSVFAVFSNSYEAASA